MVCEYPSTNCSWLWSTWVKTQSLKSAHLLIASACLPSVNRELSQKLAENRFVLLACPERESSAYYGKIASIIRSVKPKHITVVTVDGSPHCLALQASVNEAEYILGEKVEREHYVVVNGEKLERISPEAIRVARYLHLVEHLIKNSPEVLEKLRALSLEHARAEKLRQQS